MTQLDDKTPDLSLLPPLQTTWRLRSEAAGFDRVMEEVDAFGVLTGRTSYDTYDQTLYTVRPSNRLSPLPSDPPLPTIVRQQVPWWKIVVTSGVIVVIGEVIARFL